MSTLPFNGALNHYFQCEKEDCSATYFPHQVAEMRGACYCGGNLHGVQPDERDCGTSALFRMRAFLSNPSIESKSF